MGVSGPLASSPFLYCGTEAREDQLAVLHLKRDLLLPTVLRADDDKDEGYAEGKVSNTRFGSFPHSTLIGVPWGSQVRASAVDTGSRGRKTREELRKKRKRDVREDGQKKESVEDDDPEDDPSSQNKAAVEASSGFAHLLPPTPEMWTASLPHRTQVVYTPDYSYILHRIRARPGTRIIEAGAGSGSFTHAAARAVFNGDPTDNGDLEGPRPAETARRSGKVWSFEFHEPRATQLKREICEHRLDGIVELTHRDVCTEGFSPEDKPMTDIKANAVFLDLPAPWLALKHLTRSDSSPLDPQLAVHICTFSPCIEQVQRTITSLRQQGWVEIDMVELAAKRIEVRRERVGLQEEGLRGVNDSPATIDEALTRLREVEGRLKSFHEAHGNQTPITEEPTESPAGPAALKQISKQERLKNIRDAQAGRKLYKEGRLVTRPEPEIKTHTSYLVFAVLPRSWTAEDEEAAQERIANGQTESRNTKPSGAPLSKRQRKRAAMEAAGGNKAVEMEAEAEAEAEVDVEAPGG